MHRQFQNISSDSLAQLFLQAPFAICVVKGENLVLAASNSLMLNFLGVNAEDIGKSLLETQPLFVGSQYEIQMRDVLHNGSHFSGSEHEFSVLLNGEKREAYYNYSYSPLRTSNGNVEGVIISAIDVTDQVLAKKKNAESEKRFRNLIMESEVPTAVYRGEELIIEIINESAKALWNRPYEVEGMRLADALPELKGQANIALLQNALKSGETYRQNGAKVVFEKNGIKTDKYFNLFYKPLTDSAGETSSIFSMIIDVTAQTLENQVITRNEERLRKIICAMPFSVTILRGKDFVVEISNSSITENWPSEKQRKGKTLYELYPEVNDTQFLKTLQKAFETGETKKLREFPLTQLSGDIRYVSYKFTPIDFENEERIVICVGNDVTEEVLLRERLYESERDFRMLANTAPQILWTADAEGNTDFLNDRWFEFTGSVEDEDSVKTWAVHVHPDDRNDAVTQWSRSVKSGREYWFEYRLETANPQEKYRWVMVRGIPLKDDHGNIIKWFGSNTDIHEYKILQKHKDDFIGITSHELKTPLTSIKLYAQAMERLLKNEGNTKISEMAKKMSEQVNRLSDLVTELVDVTKIQNGQLTLQKNDFDFDELAEEVVKNVQHSADTHDLELQTGNTGVVYADRNRISQVMINLINNAIKYSPGSRKIIIKTDATNENAVRFRVIDFGIGIKPEELNRIFDQFYRVSEDDLHSFEGLGLGLHISKEIIDRSEGHFLVTSELGKGSDFCFEIPRSTVNHRKIAGTSPA